MTTPAAPDSSTPTSPSTGPAASSTPTPDTSTATRDLATTLDTPLPDFAMLVKGTVVANANTATPPTVSINMSGDTTTQVDGVRYLDSYSPVIGDTVLIGKQGSDMFILGQMNDSGTGSANGWQTPALGAGFTTGSGAAGTNNNGPLQYRVILDNGELKMQWRGSVAVSGTPTAVTTLPTGFRPAARKSLLLARDPGGGSNVVGCDFGTDGTVALTGTTTFGNVNGGSTGSASPGGTTAATAPGTTDSTTPGTSGSTTPTGGSAGAHTHGIFTSLDGYLSNAGSNLQHSHIGNDGVDSGGGGTASAGAHTHADSAHTHTSAAHTHAISATHSHSLTTTSHTHSFTPTGAVAAPLWVSFNGTEYFLA